MYYWSLWSLYSCISLHLLYWFFHHFASTGVNYFINPLCTGNAMWYQMPGLTLVRVMACRLSDTSPLPEPMQTYWSLYPLRTKYSEIWAQIQTCLFQEKAFEEVIFKLVAMLSGPRLNLSSCHIDGLVQDCSISSASAMEILQSCTQPSIYEIPFLLQEPMTGPKQPWKNMPKTNVATCTLDNSWKMLRLTTTCGTRLR